jgi:hypothetical protein
MDIKYPFHVERTAANVYRLTCEGSVIDVDDITDR